jgi:hypothetical protein
MKHLILLCFTFLFFAGYSQQTVHGTLLNNEAPLDEAFVFIYSKDSVALGSSISNEKGEFSLEVTTVDSVFIRVSHESIGNFTSSLLSLNEAIVLQCAKTKEIGEVEIAAKKPMVEKAPGAFILNVDQLLSATGSSAFETLAMAPGVRISSTDNISLNGKDGIIVQINGKQLPMSGSDLANYLRGIPSSNIEKIECIHTPSSKYDAAGTAIINIILKKDVRLGTNGTYNGSYGQGVYPKTSHNLTVNHRTKKAALFASYGYTFRKGFNDLQLDRHFYNDGVYDGSYIQKNYFTFPVQNHTARFSGDFNGSKGLTYGFSLTGVSNGHTRLGNNTSEVLDSTGTYTSSFATYSKTKDRWLNGTANLYMKKTIDSLGSFFSFDADYGFFTNRSDQLFVTDYLDLNGQPTIPRYMLTGNLEGDLTLFSLKGDLTKNWTKFGTIETGLKSSRVVADNDVAFYNASSGSEVLDSTKSNHFIYTEHIHSVYFTWKRSLDKFDFQAGIRAEYTDVVGDQVTTGQRNDTTYLQFFPTAFLGYHPGDNHQFELALGRRIDRPSYDQLNPFKFYLDPSTYREGNPYLRPQTTYNFDFTYILKQKYIFNANAGITSNNITEVIAPLTDEQKLTVQTNVNLKRAMVYSLAFSAPIEITKWWNMNLSVSGYYAAYTGDIAQTSIRNQGSPVGDLSAISSFSAPKGWSFEWNVFYHTPEVYAFDSIRTIAFTGVAVQKKFKEGKCLLRMALTDVFFSNGIRANVAFTDYRESFIVRRDTRVATVSFTYKFGKASVQASRRRAGGAEDLKSRVNTGGG